MAARILLLVTLLATPVAGAEPAIHTRIATPAGAIHVLRPAGYRRTTAGTVLYVHGFNTTVDRTWKKNRLEHQLAASGVNALFVAVAAPRSLEDRVRFPDLGALLGLVARRARLRLPPGPVVALGHSGGYWTIAHWLDDRRLRQVILLDGVYGFLAEYRAWITGAPARRLALLARGTRTLSRRLVRDLPGVLRRPEIPERFSPRERAARILYVDSQYGHSDLVRNGKVIPAVLQLTGLRGVARE